jgi:hypothetical protein
MPHCMDHARWTTVKEILADGLAEGVPLPISGPNDSLVGFLYARIVSVASRRPRILCRARLRSKGSTTMVSNARNDHPVCDRAHHLRADQTAATGAAIGRSMREFKDGMSDLTVGSSLKRPNPPRRPPTRLGIPQHPAPADPRFRTATTNPKSV